MDAHDRLTRQIVEALVAHLVEGKRLVIPEAGQLVWGWFLDLQGARTYSGNGPNPITFAEIAAYASLMRWELEPRHVVAIRSIDCAWLKHARQSQGEGGRSVSTAPIDPTVFDALFPS